MTERPRIGIAMDHEESPPRAMLRDAYFDAVFACGGLPILLPPIAAAVYLEPALSAIDALLLPGGDDFDPSAWGDEEVHPACTLVTARRQRFDLEVARLALARDLPVLGICCGMQALNVAGGGSVVQHLVPAADGAICHKGPSGQPLVEHPVHCARGTRLHELAGAEQIVVNSAHHQACGRLGKGLRVAGRAPDGVIEAIEASAASFAIGVQWHPEKLLDRPVHRGLFEGLCEAALRRRASTGRPGADNVPATDRRGLLAVKAGYETSERA